MAFHFSYDTGTVEIGRYRGAPIHLCASFLIPAVLLSYPVLEQGERRRRSCSTLIFAVVLFASILVHELAHAAVGRRYRVPDQTHRHQHVRRPGAFHVAAADGDRRCRHHRGRAGVESCDRPGGVAGCLTVVIGA